MAFSFEVWFNIQDVQVDLIDFSREDAASRSISINMYKYNHIIYNYKIIYIYINDKNKYMYIYTIQA